MFGCYKKCNSYFKKHVNYNSLTHVLIGMGLGILVTYPFVGVHPVRWGVGFLVVGVLAHLYPLIAKS